MSKAIPHFEISKEVDFSADIVQRVSYRIHYQRFTIKNVLFSRLHSAHIF